MKPEIQVAMVIQPFVFHNCFQTYVERRISKISENDIVVFISFFYDFLQVRKVRLFINSNIKYQFCLKEVQKYLSTYLYLKCSWDNLSRKRIKYVNFIFSAVLISNHKDLGKQEDFRDCFVLLTDTRDCDTWHSESLVCHHNTPFLLF